MRERSGRDEAARTEAQDATERVVKLPLLDELDPKTAEKIPPLAQQWEKWCASIGESDDLAAIFHALPQRLQQFAPFLLRWFWRHHRPTAEVLRTVLLSAWRYTDFPCQGCPPRFWRAMFRRVGFLSDGKIQRPSRRRVLYRGCRPKGCRGMSWTSERRVAEKFATCRVEQWRGTACGPATPDCFSPFGRVSRSSRPTARFHRPLIKPYVRFSLIRLTDSRRECSTRVACGALTRRGHFVRSSERALAPTTTGQAACGRRAGSAAVCAAASAGV